MDRKPQRNSKKDWSRCTVLVTGAGGFIGSHLVEKLVYSGARTKALVRYSSGGTRGWLEGSSVREDIEFIYGDLRDGPFLRNALKQVDVVFHLGALIAIPYSYDAPLSYLQTNVIGTFNVLEGARANDVGLIVNTSTSEVYGTARYIPIDEKHPLQGQSPYSASKIAADKLAESFYLSFDVPIVTVRPFNTYGPRQSARAVVPTIITQALQNKKIYLGNTAPTRDLNFVEDTVEGMLAVARSRPLRGETVNLGQGREISIGNLAQMICSIIGRDVPVVTEKRRSRPRKSEVDRLCCDNRKARQLAGWSPRHTLRDGLNKTIDWMREHLKGYRVGEYTK
jgi:dTDP-glucose 4,6-dehydratase